MTQIRAMLSALAIAVSLANSLSGQFLYTVNSDSNDISGFNINADTGALTTVPGSPSPRERLPFL